eukprot:3346337-Amphidinium_carterae.1
MSPLSWPFATASAVASLAHMAMVMPNRVMILSWTCHNTSTSATSQGVLGDEGMDTEFAGDKFVDCFASCLESSRETSPVEEGLCVETFERSQHMSVRKVRDCSALGDACQQRRRSLTDAARVRAHLGEETLLAQAIAA